MGTQTVSKLLKNAKTSIVKHSPEILTGIGIAGMITTTVLAVKATPKAVRLIDEYKENVLGDQEEPTVVEVVKVAWKPYIPAAITGVTSIACLIGASSVNARRNAALATAYKLSETALAEYREKVIETIGERKEKTVREKVEKDHIDKNPINNSEVIITNKGGTLCFDYYSSRYFESDIEEFKKAINRINGIMLREDYVSLNDLYDELGLDHTGTGDAMGWNVARVGRDLIKPCIGTQMAGDGRPCIVMSCDPAPQHCYDHMY